MTGRVFLVVGPSGAGKDTLFAGAAAADPSAALGAAGDHAASRGGRRAV